MSADAAARGPFEPRQTNTGLYVQLHDAGHDASGIARVAKAYDLACRLFNGRYRKSGRAFVCHAVGVASSVASFTLDLDLVIAGMLHAAYDSGQFPDGRTGKASPGHRTFLRQEVGASVEALIARYAGFAFHTGEPERMAQGDGVANDLLFIALAHELDDAADGGFVIAPKYGEDTGARFAACAALARQIGRPDMAAAIEQVGLAQAKLSWLGELADAALEGRRVAPNLRAYYRLRRAAWRGERVTVS